MSLRSASHSSPREDAATHGGPDTSGIVDVEISLVSTNNRELLRTCLRSLPAAAEGLRWHVTVIDNASEDGTAEMVAAEFPQAAFHRTEVRRGFAQNHNQVLEAVRRSGSARYVLVIHEDIELGAGSIAELVRHCDENPRVGAAGAAIVTGHDLRETSYRRFPSVWEECLRSLLPGMPARAAQGPGWLDGPCTLIRTQALQEVGLLDERFFIFYEDVDLCRRLWEAGWACALCEQAQITHVSHGTIGQGALSHSMEMQFLRSRYLYAAKHSGRARARLLAAASRASFLARAVKASAEHALGRDGDDGSLARLMWSLARYDPRQPSELE